MPDIRQRLWFDEQVLTAGEFFDNRIQEALTNTAVAIVLVSQHALTSEYITTRELPILLSRAAEQLLTLIPLYLTTMPPEALRFPCIRYGQAHTMDVHDLLSPHSFAEPLDAMPPDQRNAVYAKLATAVAAHLPRQYAELRPTGPRYDLALTLQVHGNRWDHAFALPHAPHLPCPPLEGLPPVTLLEAPRPFVDGEDLFHLLFGTNPQHSGMLIGAACGVASAAPAWQQTPQGQAHLTDLQGWFQRRWQDAPAPVTVSTVQALQDALGVGSPPAGVLLRPRQPRRSSPR